MKTLATLCSALLLFALAPRLPASQVRLPVNSATSTLEVELCAQGQCDTQISTLRGFLLIALDDNGQPTQISLRHFDLLANSDYNFHLDYGLLGDIFAHARNLRIYHAAPGPAQPFFAINAGQYTFLNVPYLTSGAADYTASGLVCGIIQGAGQPCSQNIDLATLGQNSIAQLPGTIEVVNGVASVHLDFTFSTPFDPANPGLGTISGHAIVNASGPISTSLVPPGSDWRYLDTGVEPASNWTLSGFDDSAWGFGPAQLGYGDGDEATVIGFGPEVANKYITTWFRHTFSVPDPFLYTNLALRVLRDDGVVVYLNGVEIFRDNLPPGTVTPATFAATAVGGASESIFFAAPPTDSAFLQSGLNVLAVEIHQSGPESSDLSFDLEMLGNGLFTNIPPAVALTGPTNGAVFSGSLLRIDATASDADGQVSLVEFFAGTDKIAALAGPGPNYSFTWQNACSGAYTLTARATDNGGASAVSAPVVVTVTRPPVSLISTGDVWKFLDTGSNQGTAWRANNFNDAAWPSGPAQLGFGDGDERTVVNGGPTTNRFITTYFRRAFTATNVAGASALTLRLLRDDGAVVYLNGTEVYRNNMPTGAITSATLALTNAAAIEETNFFFTASIDPALLLNSASNVIAVEVHQAAINSSDLSFDFALEVAYTNRPPAAVAVTAPDDHASVLFGPPITLQVSASDPDGSVRRVEYFAGTNRLGQSSAPNLAFVWHGAPAGVHLLTARAVDDCDAGTVSAPVTLRVGTATLVPTGAVWKYLDTGVNQGAAWRANNFNDAAWPSGRAQLGFGDNDEATVINGGPATNRFPATYFRRAFSVANASQVLGLFVRLLRDDGVVIYLNGAEVLRSNMPTGAVVHTTLASAAVGGADESAFFLSPIDAEPLVSGMNVLAVEVHQSAITSSDLSFDVELIVVMPPALFITAAPGGHQLRWPSAAAGYAPFAAGSLTPPVNWQRVLATPSDDGTWKSLTLPNAGAARFYRLSTE